MNIINRYNSPLGGITIASDGDAITGLWFDGQKYFGSTLTDSYNEAVTPVIAEARKWLDIYFQGKEPDFPPRLNLVATPFRKLVLEKLLLIPYGSTVSYKDIAKSVAKDMNLSRMSAQAVGGAIGHNPISLIVPCHRVIASNGGLTGYAAGINIKSTLLKMEGADLFSNSTNDYV